MGDVNVLFFRLGGATYYGGEAGRLFAIAEDFGWEEVCAVARPWPDDREPAHYVMAKPTGVTGFVEIGFDDRESMLSWFTSAKIVEASDEVSEAFHKTLCASLSTVSGQGTRDNDESEKFNPDQAMYCFRCNFKCRRGDLPPGFLLDTGEPDNPYVHCPNRYSDACEYTTPPQQALPESGQ